VIKKSLSRSHFNFRWDGIADCFRSAKQIKLNNYELPLIRNFCAQISETAERKQSAISPSES